MANAPLSDSVGSAAGGALVALELLVLEALGVPPSIGEALAVAVGWSAALLIAGLAVRRLLRGIESDRPRPGALLAYHLVFGVGLGLWIRMTWIT